MSRKEMIAGEKDFLQQELFQTRQQLFSATSVREMKFLQNKIAYLMQKVMKKEKKRK